MMARRGVVGLLAGGAAALLGGCGLFRGNSYRFRMTVEVDTPSGLRTGSSVYEVSADTKVAITREMADRGWRIRGEALSVDLPDGRTLFALLKTGAHFDDMMGLSMNALHPDFRGTGYDVVGVARELAHGKYPGPAEVAPQDYPLLVTFGDISDPASVMRIAPANLAVAFGPDTALHRITVELTSDPVSKGIEERLEWLSTHRGTLMPDPPRLLKDATPIQLVGPSAFSTELYR